MFFSYIGADTLPGCRSGHCSLAGCGPLRPIFQVSQSVQGPVPHDQRPVVVGLHGPDAVLAYLVSLLQVPGQLQRETKRAPRPRP